jgi:chitin disaccharide deacetylase
VQEKRFLIINADDLGYTRGINRVIAHCHRQGVVTSATLMANGNAFEDALTTIQDLPGLGVGVHLVLTELKPVSAPHLLPGLVSRHGNLPATPVALFRAVLTGTVSPRLLETEMERQVMKVIDRGVAITHLDTHKHVHVLPPILEAVLQVARKCGIRWIRNPFDETSLADSWVTLAGRDRLSLCRQYLTTRPFSLFRWQFRHRLRHAGLHCPDHFFGTVTTGLWNAATARQTLPRGVSEWMTHPGEHDAELQSQHTRLRASREQEQELLLAPAFKHLLQSHQITLTHYGDHAR